MTTTPLGEAFVVQGNALDLSSLLPNDSVDLIVTSPPYFGLRSYTDGGEHMAHQVGGEATPTEYVDALIAATREMMRVLKPSGSIWVNLGDKYAGGGMGGHGKGLHGPPPQGTGNSYGRTRVAQWRTTSEVEIERQRKKMAKEIA